MIILTMLEYKLNHLSSTMHSHVPKIDFDVTIDTKEVSRLRVIVKNIG